MGQIKSPAPALSKGLLIVELIAEHGKMSFNEIQKATGFNVSSLNRLLKVLVETDYLTKSFDTKYEVGLKIAILAKGTSVWNTLVKRIRPLMVDISDKYEVSMMLIIPSNEKVIVLEKVSHPNSLNMMKPGTEVSLEKECLWTLAYIAWLPEEERKKYLEKNEGWVHINQLIKYEYDNGYFYDNLIMNPNIRRICAPLKGPNKKMIAQLGVGFFKEQLDEEKIQELVKDIKAIRLV